MRLCVPSNHGILSDSLSDKVDAWMDRMKTVRRYNSQKRTHIGITVRLQAILAGVVRRLSIDRRKLDTERQVSTRIWILAARVC